MDRNLPFVCIVLPCVLAVCAVYLLAQSAVEQVAGLPGEKVLCDFEDGDASAWHGMYRTTLGVEESERAHGKRWLRFTIEGDPYPGMWYIMRPAQDWSGYRALRFRVLNPSNEVVKLSIRMDDDDGGRHVEDYAQRYNLEDAFKLQPGANEIELTLAAARLGTPGSRGLDVRRMEILALFIIQPGKPVTLYLDDVRLVSGSPAPGAGPLLIADFDGKGPTKWDTSHGGTFKVGKRPDGVDGAALEVTFPAGQQYPGVQFRDMPGDWLSWDFLCVDVFCPKDRPTPRHLFLNVKGTDGTSAWLCTPVEKGLNKLRVPLQLAGFASLGGVSGLDIFTDFAMKDETVWIDNLRLERQPSLLCGGAGTPAAKQGRLVLDFHDLETDDPGARYGALAWIPLESGATRSVLFTSLKGGPVAYSFSGEMLRGANAKAPIRVWAFVHSRQCWYWTRSEVTLKDEAPVTLDLDDITPFGF